MALLDEIRKGESKTLEFKEVFTDKKKLIKTIIAFSNTAGGKLLIGVGDDGKIVLVVEVVRGNQKPYYHKAKGRDNGTYFRLGATNREASAEYIQELERQKRNISYDEEICYNAELSNLDLSSLINKFKDKGKALDDDKLKNLKLIKTESGKTYPTNGLMIILGLFPHCIVKCARFKGNTMEDIFNGRSEARNRVVSNIFKELSLIEQWGTGIGRIITSCKEHGLDTPRISEQNDFFDIEIKRSKAITDDYGRLSDDYRTKKRTFYFIYLTSQG